MNKKIITVLFLSFLLIGAYAQSKPSKPNKKAKTEKETKKNSQKDSSSNDTLIPAKESTKPISDTKNSQVKVTLPNDSTAILREQIRHWQDSVAILSKQIQQKQDLINSLQKELTGKEETIQRQNEKNDSLTIIQAITRLDFKYKPERIAMILGSIHSISSKKIKEDYADVIVLLENYQRLTNELITVLEEAQHDSQRNNPAFEDEYKQYFTLKLENIEKQCTMCTTGEKYELDYLKKMILSCKQILNNHTIRNKADFTKKIEELKS